MLRTGLSLELFFTEKKEVGGGFSWQVSLMLFSF